VDGAQVALVGGAAVAGGIVNAIAGGGSLLTFPALVACGVPSVVASLTNTVAMCPGYFGATIAQRKLLVGQGGRAWRILPAGLLGGVAGAWLLLTTGEAAFDVIVPFLLVLAAALLATQGRLRTYLAARAQSRGKPTAAVWGALAVGIAAVYGGYFGAAMGVIVLAALAVVLDDDLVRVNALKQAVSLVVNVAAAVVFVASGRVDWMATAVMAGASLIGGAVGGRIASHVPSRVLRAIVISFALAVAAYYFSRLL
jgi:uncharacterized membrane protein YfcA